MSKPCFECDGTGVVTVYQAVGFDPADGYVHESASKEVCEDCDGTGVERDEAMKAGVAAHAAALAYVLKSPPVVSKDGQERLAAMGVKDGDVLTYEDGDAP